MDKKKNTSSHAQRTPPNASNIITAPTRNRRLTSQARPRAPIRPRSISSSPTRCQKKIREKGSRGSLPWTGKGVFLANSPLPSPSHLPSFPTPPPRTKPAKPAKHEPGRQSDGRDPRCRNQTQPTNQQDPKAQDATNEHSLTEPHTPRRRTSSSLLRTIGRRPRPEQ